MKHATLIKNVIRTAGIFALLSTVSCSFDGMHNLLDRDEMLEKDRKEGEAGRKFDFLRKDEERPLLPAHQSIQEEEVKNKAESQADAGAKARSTAEKPVTAFKAPEKAKPAEPFYENFLLLDNGEDISVSLVFNSAPILDVIPAFADALGFNFVADQDIKGTITLNLNTKMTKRELWNAFDRLLATSGVRVVAEDSLLRFMPLSKFGQRGDLVTAGENSEILYYPLRYATAKEAVTQLKPFLGAGGTVTELTRPNAVITSDVKENLPKLRQILDLLDANRKSAWPRAVIRCDHILPSKLVTELTAIMPTLGFNVYQTTDKTELPGSIRMSSVDRLQLLTATAATEEAIQEIRNWVAILDGSDSLDEERVFVYKVMNGKADQLMQALAVIYNTSGTTLTVDSNTGNNRTQTVNSQNSRTSNQNRTNNSRNAQSAVNNATTTQTDLSSSIFEKPVKVFSDGTLNRLVIRTTPRTYASIKALLDRLDVVPAQVLLQVLVVEVTLTDSTQFGLEFSKNATIGGQNVTFGTNYGNKATATSEKTSGQPKGFSMLMSDPDDPENTFGYIRALAGNNQVKVISSPQVLVSSHKEATITVGSKIPYVASALTSTSSVTESGGTYNSQVKYQDTGITLTITPEVTSTNMIGIEVMQELSTAVQNSLTEVDAPEFPTRKVETNMTIPNGKTMVIGGLIQETKNDELNSVPIISEIPMLRRLFGNTNATVERTEVLVMITGYIVDEKSKTEEMIKRYNDAVKALNDFDSKLGDRSGAATRMQILDEKDVGKIGR